jgi:hypothetical protein
LPVMLLLFFNAVHMQQNNAYHCQKDEYNGYRKYAALTEHQVHILKVLGSDTQVANY